MSAVVSEEHQLVNCKCNEDSLDWWIEISCHGVYERAHQFACHAFGLTGLSQLAADVALSGPLDIACQVGALDIDDVHPGPRLRKLRDFASRNYMRGGVPWKSMQDDVFPTQRLFSTSEIEVSRSLSGREFWGRDFIGNSAEHLRRRGEKNAEELRIAKTIDKLSAASEALFSFFLKERAAGRRPSRRGGGGMARAPMTLYRGDIAVNSESLKSIGLSDLEEHEPPVFLLFGLVQSLISKSVILGAKVDPEFVRNIREAPSGPEFCDMLGKLARRLVREDTLRLHCPQLSLSFAAP